MPQPYEGPLQQAGPNTWRIPRDYKPGMRVDGLIFADETLVKSILLDRSPEQVANVACLPGIVGSSLAMPDIHWGYGFCIGGVAATDPDQDGVISPGGVGYDINCGVRLLRTNIKRKRVDKRIDRLVDCLFETIPCGVGRRGRVRYNHKELTKVLEEGAKVAVDQGMGWDSDIETTEARGCLPGARPDFVSKRAYDRGHDQCGTLGSGNHFIEVQVVERIEDKKAAEAMGLEEDHIVVMIHSGSRALGYQVCEDSLKDLRKAPAKYGIDLPDRQLACAPVHSPEGERYLGAMRAAANFAWSNRQIMAHLVRLSFEEVFEVSAEELGMWQVYDVAHNIAKIETHHVGGRPRSLCVHRKGATRAFPAGHPELPGKYKAIGQPVLVPGDMGNASYVLVGTQTAMDSTFGSCCHGAGRVMSRSAAIKAARGRSIKKELLSKGVVARARSREGLDEEQPDAYKDVVEVVNVLHEADIARRVAKLRPLGVIKG